MRNLMDQQELIEHGSYDDQVNSFAKERACFWTRSDHISLKLNLIKVGDQAYTVLGCQALLVLRSDAQKDYRAVGECYIDRLIEGVALVWCPAQRIFRHLPNRGNYTALMNVTTGDVQVEEPRRGPLPAGWRIADH